MISWPFHIGNNFCDKCCEQQRRKQSKGFQVSYVVDMNRCADQSVTWSYGPCSSQLRSALLGPTVLVPPSFGVRYLVLRSLFLPASECVTWSYGERATGLYRFSS